MVKTPGFEEVASVVSAIGKTPGNLKSHVRDVEGVDGELNAESLGKALNILHGRKIAGISAGKNSTTIFVEMEDEKALLSQLCKIRELKGVSLKENVGAIEILNAEFIESPGWIAKISKALAKKGINIVETSSSKAAISVFLEDKDVEKALEALKAIS